ncbi:MAG: hypothetical protein KY475_11840 [Planctomycetes bacterium]|nr:hypothetical protein [Planctomycetota bacterium]
MVSHALELKGLSDLRQYVYEMLSHHHDLVVGAFPMTERILVRGGKPCGMYFCLHGPRSVRLTAIWETDRNSILFYGVTGERLSKTEVAPVAALAPA